MCHVSRNMKMFWGCAPCCLMKSYSIFTILIFLVLYQLLREISMENSAGSVRHSLGRDKNKRNGRWIMKKGKCGWTCVRSRKSFSFRTMSRAILCDWLLSHSVRFRNELACEFTVSVRHRGCINCSMCVASLVVGLYNKHPAVFFFQALIFFFTLYISSWAPPW